MNLTIITLLFIVICHRSSSKLIALSPGYPVLKLYHKLQNENAPTDLHPFSILGAPFRESICENIAESEFLKNFFAPVSKRKVYRKRRLSRYANIFTKIYTCNSSGKYEYTNLYQQYQFTVLMSGNHDFKEYLFVCPFKDQSDGSILPFYVSKEYNVGSFGDEPYMPGRFIFPTLVTLSTYTYPKRFYTVILAEKPAIAFTKPNFNIEIYYLGIRRYIQPAESNAIDPLCRMISENRYDPNNQHHRFCEAVFTSTYFKDKIKYPEMKPKSCVEEEVTFKTAEGIAGAAGNVYHEWMTLCNTNANSRETKNSLYISRAYKSNEVFVYRRDPANGKISLENLSVNIGIVDELNSFDFTED